MALVEVFCGMRNRSPVSQSEYLGPLTYALCVTALMTAPATAQGTRLAALVAAEVGYVQVVGPFAGMTAEAIAATARWEARASLSKLGGASGCQGISCQLRDVSLQEIGLGIPVGANTGALRGWLIGVGVGRATEKADRPRLAWGPYIARSWQVTSLVVARAEARFRSLRGRTGESLVGGILRLSVGVSSR